MRALFRTKRARGQVGRFLMLALASVTWIPIAGWWTAVIVVALVAVVWALMQAVMAFERWQQAGDDA